MSMNRFAAFVFGILVLGWATSAQAQVYSGDEEGPQVLYSSSTTTTSSALGIAMIYATVASTIPDDSSAAVELYLRENSVALSSDLALGAGETVDDLAGLLRVPDDERARFGRALRLASQRLIVLADPTELDRGRASEFVVTARRTWLLLRISESSAS